MISLINSSSLCTKNSWMVSIWMLKWKASGLSCLGIELEVKSKESPKRNSDNVVTSNVNFGHKRLPTASNRHTLNRNFPLVLRKTIFLLCFGLWNCGVIKRFYQKGRVGFHWGQALKQEAGRDQKLQLKLLHLRWKHSSRRHGTPRSQWLRSHMWLTNICWRW